MDTQWSTPTRYLVAVGLALIGLYGLYLCSSILPIIIIGALLAFLVRPLIRLLHDRLKAPRGVAILVAYLIAIIIILIAPLIFIPPIVNAVSFLIDLDYQLLIDRSLNGLETNLVALKAIDLRLLSFNLDLGNLVDPALTALQSTEPGIALQLPSLETLLNSLSSIFATSYGVAMGVIGTVFSGAISFVFVIITAIYFSVDGGKLYKWFLRLTPPPYRLEMTTLLARLEVVWARFCRPTDIDGEYGRVHLDRRRRAGVNRSFSPGGDCRPVGDCAGGGANSVYCAGGDCGPAARLALFAGKHVCVCFDCDWLLRAG